MATEEELWELVTHEREGVLATVRRDGTPQLSNVLYAVDEEAGLIRISTTADRAKARILRRNPAASLHVAGEDFWHYAVVEGHTTVTDPATTPGDAVTDELALVHGTLYGAVERPAFDQQMIENRRLVVRLPVERIHGVLAPSARRPVSSR
jgi:PPOX class probable F420-dependent enzyme